MGLLAEAEKHELLNQLTKEKKQYYDNLDVPNKKIIESEIDKIRTQFKFEKTQEPETAQSQGSEEAVPKEQTQQQTPPEQVAAEPAKSDDNDGFITTGIEGFDKLLDKGIPRGIATLVVGGPGSGKTIFCLQIMMEAVKRGKKCYYMSFEEKEERLKHHMKDFGWDAEEYEAKGILKIKRYDPFEITRSVEALMEKAKGELMIDVTPVLFPDDFTPDIVIIDSLSAIGSAFANRSDGYRTYIEQLFKLFERIKANSFFITEVSEGRIGEGGSAIEEFLSDAVVIIYNIKQHNIRESAIEILKMRGAKFQKRIVAMQILSGYGIQVYPEQKIYSNTSE